MSYQALYRVWRPQKFQDIAGQKAITQTLRNALMQKKTSHAYLFTGPRGTGKTSGAKIFAKAINCHFLKDGEPCNECETCVAITKGQLNDVIEIDAASNNGVEEIRDIRDKAKYAPTSADYKIYIIDEVHMLSTGAFNALLKTLEEPPKNVVFILATTEPHKIPLTIIS
ncbi:MAG: DNA polymerase III subunit gamma/tau, partial [Carnobacterium sp.]